MRVFGLELSAKRLRRALSSLRIKQTLSGVGQWFTIHDTYPGAWQQHVRVSTATVAESWAVYGCVTLIANDISKMPARVMQWDESQRIWAPTLLRPLLRKPNHFQTRIEFFRCWIFSLLLYGNTYVLKERNAEGHVVALYVLDPQRVTPLVAEDGGIYYRLNNDNLNGIPEASITVPASEVIHDRINTLWHPLICISPISACGSTATQALAIQDNSTKFFQNMSRPSGILTAPGSIADTTAARIKQHWDENFTGENAGKVAVLGDGLSYQQMTIAATDAQLIEQLKFTGEMVCAVFHVPPYKLGLGPMPTVNNTGLLNQQYYDQGLQPIVESMELRLDDGLELPRNHEVWLDESAILRMDQASRFESYNKAIGGGWMAPNEARREEDMPPVEGGDSPLMQQQNYSLAALAKRDANDPFAKPEPAATPSEPEELEEEDETEKALYFLYRKSPETLAHA